MTYNQVSFIEDTLNGFMIQKVSFPVVYVIVDDASTDGEQELLYHWAKKHLNLNSVDAYIREVDYANILFGPYSGTPNMFFAILLLHNNLYNEPQRKLSYIAEWCDNAKYLALCEGDDYWIDPQKLQTQVDFLNNHQEYVLTCHRYKIFDYEKQEWKSDSNSYLFSGNEGISFGMDYKVWLAKTLSLLFRRDAMEEFNRRASNKRDTVLVYFLLKEGKAYCFNKIMGVYTLHFGSTCGKKSISENRKTAYEVSKYIYNIDKNKYARLRYYRNYMYALYHTKGKLLFEEKFEILKFISVPYFFLKEICDSIFYRIRLIGKANGAYV
jgi:GT2 family glycosyltransferase